MSIVWIAGPVALLLAALVAAVTIRRLRVEALGLAAVERDLTELRTRAAAVRADADRLADRVAARHGAEAEPGAR